MLLQDRLINTERARLFIALLALVASLAGVFTLPVLDRDEARFAQASAQMAETGDIIDIRFQDQPRHKKPIGIYWMQSLTVAVTTGPAAREIWTYRLPSVLGAMLAALSAFWIGRRLGQPAARQRGRHRQDRRHAGRHDRAERAGAR